MTNLPVLVGRLVAVAEKAGGDQYLSAEDRARVEIDQKLAASGWLVQPYKAMNLGARPRGGDM